MTRPSYVHMKGRERGKPAEGNFKLLRDGSLCGGSIHREGILEILLGSIQQRAGHFQVLDGDTGEVMLDYHVDSPTWEKDESPKKPWDDRHEWQSALFYAGDEVDEAFCFEGFHRGGRWNGWADPWFQRDQVARIITMVSDADGPFYKFTWIRDVLIVDDSNLECVRIYEPTRVLIDGVERDLYNLFGGGYFTWDVYDGT